MKYSFLSIPAALLLLNVAASCDKSSTIGASLTNDNVRIIVDSAFTVTGSTKSNAVVQSRTVTQLLGSIDAPGFGSITSDFVTQFMPSLLLDTTGVYEQDIDSMRLFMQLIRGDFTGDSLTPMGLEVYRLTKNITSPIYSNFDPDGYYNPDEPLASLVYTSTDFTQPDSVKAANSYPQIVTLAVNLPAEIGREMLSAFRADPSMFSRPEEFADKVFKGIYVRNSYGSGRIVNFSQTAIRMYYHKVVGKDSVGNDSIGYFVSDCLAATPEVVVNNNISYTVAPELSKMVEQGDNVLAAPAGLDMELTFPAPAIAEAYRKYSNNSDELSVLNTLTFSIPAEKIANKYNIAPPPYALLVLKKDKDKFFSNNQLPDGTTSFYAQYDSVNCCYSFPSMRSFIVDFIEKENPTPEDYTFALCPVQVNTETNQGYYSTTTVETSVVPYVSKPAMAKISLDKAKIRLTFSVQNLKNY